MNLWSKFSNFFGGGQYLDANNNQSCEFNQAGGDITKVAITNNYFGSTANLLLDHFAEEKAREIKKMIEEGHITFAEFELSKIFTTGDFSALDTSKQAEYFYLNGLISLRKGSSEVILHQVNKLRSIGEEVKANQLAIHLALANGDENAFQASLANLRKCGVPSDECDVFLGAYYVCCQQSDLAISILTTGGVIKPSLVTNSDARLYLGLAYCQKLEYGLAKNEFDTAYKSKPLPYTKYLLTIATINPIVARKGVLLILSDEDRELITQCISSFQDIEYFFKEQLLEQKVEYWMNRLTASLILDPVALIQYIPSLTLDIQRDDLIQIILGDAYFLTNDYPKAQAVFDAIYRQNRKPEILMKIAVAMYNQSSSLEIIQLLKDLPYSNFDNEGIIASIYINSYDKHNDYDQIKPFIEDMEKEFGKCLIFLEEASLIAFRNRDFIWSKSLIQRAIEGVKKSDSLVSCLSIADCCLKMGLIDEAIDVLRPCAKDFDIGRKKLLNLLLSTDNAEYLNEAKDIADKAISSTKGPFYYTIRADALIKERKHYQAFLDYERAFEIEPSIRLAYNASIAYLQSQSANYKVLEKYLNILQTSTEPCIISLYARLLHLCKHGGVQQVIYRALHVLGEDFDEFVYLEYIKLLSPLADPTKKDEVVDYECVQEDCVVTLLDNLGQKRLICFERDSSIVGIEGECSFCCEHYSVRNLNFTLLQGRRVDSLVTLENTEYRIENCINKFVFALRHCFNRFRAERPDSPYLKSMESTSNNEIISKLIPVLEQVKQADEYVLGQYNISNGERITLLAIVHGNTDRYIDGMIKLLNNEKQIFYAGISYFIPSSQVPVVMTLSSILMLEFVKCLRLTRSIAEVYVPESLLLLVDNIINSVSINNATTSCSISIGDDGKPHVYENTDEQKMNRLTFWQNIRAEISNWKSIEDVPQIASITMPNILLADLDAISLARVKNAILVCDDVCMRTLCDSSGIPTITNSSRIIHQYGNLDDRLNALSVLTKTQYAFCCLESDLMDLFKQLSEISPLLGEGTRFSNLRSIVNNLCKPTVFRFYLPIFRNILHNFLTIPISMPANDEILLMLIGELRKSILISKKLNETGLLLFLTEPCGLDVIREQHIKCLFKRSKRDFPLVEAK